MHIKLPDVYPYDLGRFKQDFPNTSAPDVWSDSLLEEFGIFKVEPTTQPDYVYKDQRPVELAPVNDGGVWRQAWQIVERDVEDKQNVFDARASDIRAQRNERLRSECDCINPARWETMTDAQKDQARAHRQALLDVPNQPGFPWSVNWPTNPL